MDDRKVIISYETFKDVLALYFTEDFIDDLIGAMDDNGVFIEDVE